MDIKDAKVGQRVRVKSTPDGFGAFGGTFGIIRRIDSEEVLVLEFNPATLTVSQTLSLHTCQGFFLKPVGLCLFASRVDLAPLETNESQPAAKTTLPSDATERKTIPIGSGVLDYFPAALAEVARVSYKGNQQHNPGQPLNWARGKSMDHADTLMRHFIERGTVDTDGMRHSAKMAWRALAILQLEMESEGAPLPRGCTVATDKK